MIIWYALFPARELPYRWCHATIQACVAPGVPHHTQPYPSAEKTSQLGTNDFFVAAHPLSPSAPVITHPPSLGAHTPSLYRGDGEGVIIAAKQVWRGWQGSRQWRHASAVESLAALVCAHSTNCRGRQHQCDFSRGATDFHHHRYI